MKERGGRCLAGVGLQDIGWDGHMDAWERLWEYGLLARWYISLKGRIYKSTKV